MLEEFMSREVPYSRRNKGKVSKYEAYKDQILILRSKGYSLNQIVKYLYGEGVDAKKASLGNFISKL